MSSQAKDRRFFSPPEMPRTYVCTFSQVRFPSRIGVLTDCEK